MIAAQSAKSWCQIHIDLASPSLGGDIPIYQAEKSPFWGWNRQFLMLKSPCVLKWPIEIDGSPIKKMWFSMAMLVITRWYMYNFFMVGEAKNPHGDHSGLIPGLRDTEAALHHGRSGSRGLRRIKELGIWAEHRKGTNRWTNYIYKYIYITLYHYFIAVKALLSGQWSIYVHSIAIKTNMKCTISRYVAPHLKRHSHRSLLVWMVQWLSQPLHFDSGNHQLQ